MYRNVIFLALIALVAACSQQTKLGRSAQDPSSSTREESVPGLSLPPGATLRKFAHIDSISINTNLNPLATQTDLNTNQIGYVRTNGIYVCRPSDSDYASSPVADPNGCFTGLDPYGNFWKSGQRVSSSSFQGIRQDVNWTATWPLPQGQGRFVFNENKIPTGTDAYVVMPASFSGLVDLGKTTITDYQDSPSALGNTCGLTRDKPCNTAFLFIDTYQQTIQRALFNPDAKCALAPLPMLNPDCFIALSNMTYSTMDPIEAAVMKNPDNSLRDVKLADFVRDADLLTGPSAPIETNIKLDTKAIVDPTTGKMLSTALVAGIYYMNKVQKDIFKCKVTETDPLNPGSPTQGYFFSTYRNIAQIKSDLSTTVEITTIPYFRNVPTDGKIRVLQAAITGPQGLNCCIVDSNGDCTVPSDVPTTSSCPVPAFNPPPNTGTGTCPKWDKTSAVVSTTALTATVIGNATTHACTWSNASTGPLSQDGAYATCSSGGGVPSNMYPDMYLTGQLQGAAALPDNAVIKGIVVNCNMGSIFSNGRAYNTAMQLMKGGAPVGQDRASIHYITENFIQESCDYGSPTDLWGTTWTAAEIKNPGFGIKFGATRYQQGASVDMESCKVAIYWDPPQTSNGAATSLQVSFGSTGGTVTGSDPRINGTLSGGGGGTYTFGAGDYIQILAKPDPCYQFDHWEIINGGSCSTPVDGSNSTTTNPINVSILGGNVTSVKPYFTAIPGCGRPSLLLSVSGGIGATITNSAGAPNLSCVLPNAQGNCVIPATEDGTVTLRANPVQPPPNNGCWKVSGWNLSCPGCMTSGVPSPLIINQLGPAPTNDLIIIGFPSSGPVTAVANLVLDTTSPGCQISMNLPPGAPCTVGANCASGICNAQGFCR